MNCKYLLAAALLVGTAWPLSAQSVRAGIDAWQNSDYSGAVAIWRPLAEKGDADAEFNLGQAYRLGRGVPTNLAAAKTWFERAATQGHMDAQTTLGLLLFENGNQPEGLKWLKKAADQGEPRALLVYGTALVNGDSVTQDPALGYAYVSRAAELGLAPAKDTLQQLDQLLPLADRKRGSAIAHELAKAASPPASEPQKTAKANPSKSAKAKPRSGSSPEAAGTKVASAEASKSAPTPSSEPIAAPKGNWRIQLGAFSQKGSAEALYARLQGKAALSGRHAFYSPVGAITRLQVGPFESKSAAQSACSAIGVPCFPVAAK